MAKRGRESTGEAWVPSALPASLGDGLQGRVQAVGMVADVTVVTEQEPPGVSGFPAGLTHGALQAPPAFAKNHFRDLQRNKQTMFYTTKPQLTLQDQHNK